MPSCVGWVERTEAHRALATTMKVVLPLRGSQAIAAMRRRIFANRQERFSHLIAILKSVPGIDEIWACIIAAEIGDFARFPNADALEFWAGMTADLKESAGRTQSGKITKAGSACLRWAICTSAPTWAKARLPS